jgi:hypothetical protein
MANCRCSRLAPPILSLSQRIIASDRKSNREQLVEKHGDNDDGNDYLKGYVQLCAEKRTPITANRYSDEQQLATDFLVRPRYRVEDPQDVEGARSSG